MLSWRLLLWFCPRSRAVELHTFTRRLPAQQYDNSKCASSNELAGKSSESAKPGQQVIIYSLRPLLLSPVAAAWKRVKPPQVWQCASHRGQAVSEHMENSVPLAGDVERRLFNAAPLETA
jgi:hypothetical protein